MPSLCVVLLIFSLQFSLIFFNISLARLHQHCSVLLVLIRNIGHRTLPKIWIGTFLVRSVQLRGKDFALILTVKWKLKMASLAVNFRQSVITVELWRPEIARPDNFVNNFCVFWKKTPYVKQFQNFVPKVFAASQIDVVVFECCTICLTENRRNRALFTGQKQTKFRLPLKLSLLRRSRSKSVRPSP